MKKNFIKNNTKQDLKNVKKSQVICNKMDLYPILDELMDLKRL